MSITESELHLDGNADASWLADVFCGEITTAEVTCVSCGRLGPVGSLTAYGLHMGVVLRCPSCDQVMIRLARIHERYWLDLRGAIALRIGPAPALAEAD